MSIKSELQQANANLEALRKVNELLKVKTAYLSGKNEQLKDQIIKLRETMQLKAQQTDRIKAQIPALREQNKLKSEYLNDQVTKLRETIQLKIEQADKIKSQIPALREQSKLRSEHLNDQIIKLREIIQLKTEQTGKLKKQISALNKQTDNIKTQILTLHEQSKLKSKNIQILKEQLVALRADYQEKHESLMKSRADGDIAWVRHLQAKFDFADWVNSVWEHETLDVCIAHDSPGLEAGVAVKTKTGCALVYDCVEFPDHRSGFSKVAKQFQDDPRGFNLVINHEYRLYEQADAIFAGTDTILNWFRKNPNVVEGSYVQNCLDYQEVTRSKQILRDCGIDDNAKLIITPNTLHLEAYLEEFLKALNMLPDDVHYANMGSISQKAEEVIRERATALGISERVHFLPLKSPKDLIEYRSGAHIALIPLDPAIELYHHCKPNRLMESIMSRTPILTSNLKFVRELVEDEKCGECYTANDAKLIAKKISLILDNHDAYFKNTDLAAKKYCWKNERKVFIKNLDGILANDRKQDIVLIANKRLTTNQRNYRHVRTLVELGHNLTVYCLHPPVPFLSVPGVKYISRDGEIDPLAPNSYYDKD